MMGQFGIADIEAEEGSRGVSFSQDDCNFQKHLDFQEILA